MSAARPPEKIKVSDYVAAFIAGLGVRHVFAITGGASIHMIHSIAERDDLDFVCPHHEQAAAMAADGYARVTGGFGVAVATSGPGATNLLTGVACSWFDSVPVLYLTGQVARFRFKGDTGVRQMGFQETDIVSMAAPITKYAKLVTEVEALPGELLKAVEIARSGRPGPVLIDIPDDMQRELVDPERMRAAEARARRALAAEPSPDRPIAHPAPSAAELDRVAALLRAAERPVVVAGWGVRLAGAEAGLLALIDRLGAPVCPSWAIADLFPGDHPTLAGTFGTHGARAGNFTVQNADLVLAVGARLSTRETGSPLSSWARGAKTVIVDIDPAELQKFPTFDKEIDVPVRADAKLFVEALTERLSDADAAAIRRRAAPWRARVADWRTRYPVVSDAHRAERATNPYVFVDALSDALDEDDVIVVDTGCAVAWTMQGFRFKRGQRLFHAFNTTPMGYALPAALGVAYARPGRRVVCIAGDGSLMMNLQEMATAQVDRADVKLFLINNDGYAMVQQTQEQWLGGAHHATSRDGGLAFPDFQKIADACGFAVSEITENAHVAARIAETLAADGPSFCDVQIAASQRVTPQSKFGRPIEDAEPLLPRDEFLANMIVPPVDASLVEEA